MVKTTTIEMVSKKEFELIKITQDVLNFVGECGIKNGIVYVITAHTTTGILVNESLPCLETDIEEKLEELVPTKAPYAHNHFLPSYGAMGGNTPGHLKSMLVGNHAVFPLIDGHIVCGNAQDIYFAEFEGIQRRKVYITVMGE
jgi:secondary thiamine-phosphate synthase enzyme